MAMQSNKLMVAKSVLSTLGSTAAAAMVARSIINDFLPYEIRNFLFSSLHSIFSRRLNSEITMIIEEFEGLETNHIFEAAQLYIGACTAATSSAPRLKVRKPDTAKPIQVNVDRDQEVVDVFEGIKFKWLLNCHHVESRNYHNPQDMNATLRSEVRSLHLTFHKKFKKVALEKYLPHILNKAELLKQQTKTVKLFSFDNGNAWTSINLNHPSTFETVAMDLDLKEMIIKDLRRFVRRKEYYQHVGKAWKRGYLLYGPPGTGKSSLIAAIANYLNFDIYDLQISDLRFDWELRGALLGTASKSIIVIEDIDCAIELNDRDVDQGYNQQDKVTLSGLLNFMDGLWSTCGDERIIIFTTNHKDKLDAALLRPGRMDLHIHMSYCTPCGFNLLANNYLRIKHHQHFPIIEGLIQEVEVTPAEVAEQLMKNDEVDLALKGLVDFLKVKKVEDANDKAMKLEDEKSKSKVVDENKDDETKTKSVEEQANRGGSYPSRGMRGGRSHRVFR